MEIRPVRLTLLRKSVSAVATAVLALPLLAAPSYAASGTAANHFHLVSANARLITGLDSKDARQGERVTAKLTGSVKAADSMDLPKGTVLIGRVAHVQDSTKKGPAKLSLVFDQALLHNGHTIRIKATLLGAYPGPSSDSYFDMGVGGSYVGTEPHNIPYDQRVEQEPGTLSHVAMRSAVQSRVSGIFTSKNRNINLQRGTELQFAIAPATGKRVG